MGENDVQKPMPSQAYAPSHLRSLSPQSNDVQKAEPSQAFPPTHLRSLLPGSNDVQKAMPSEAFAPSQANAPTPVDKVHYGMNDGLMVKVSMALIFVLWILRRRDFTWPAAAVAAAVPAFTKATATLVFSDIMEP